MMSLLHLTLRNIRYYGRSLILAILAVAVATAVITGSFIVGDSVKGSLRRNALSHIGATTHALVATTPFSDDLGRRIQIALPAIKTDTSILTVKGSVRSDSNGIVLPIVHIIGCDKSITTLFPGSARLLIDEHNIAVNKILADALSAKNGDDIILSVPKYQYLPSDSLFAHRNRSEAIVTMRLHIAQIVGSPGIADFSLDMTAAKPYNLYISRTVLGEQLGCRNAANIVLCNAENVNDQAFQDVVNNTAKYTDCGLSIHNNGHYLSLNSKHLLLTQSELQAAHEAAINCGLTSRNVSVFLATSVKTKATGASIAYSVVGCVEGVSPTDPSTALINDWAMKDLGSLPSSSDKKALTISCLKPNPDGSYGTLAFEADVKDILPMKGFGADKDLTPDFEGITDAKTIADWHPPFPIDLSKITKRDEDYWDRYKAAPRLLVSEDRARWFWSQGQADSNADWVTSAIITHPQIQRYTAEPALTDMDERRFIEAFNRHFLPSSSGLVLRPLRASALHAATGSTDFSELFLSLGFFLIIAASIATSMIMQLSIERRSSEIGLLKAIGFQHKKIGRLIISEALLVCMIGAALGSVLGIFYAKWILYLLSGPWSGAAAGATFQLFINPSQVINGLIFGSATGVTASAIGVLKAVKQPILSLLAGWKSPVLVRNRKPSFWKKAVFFILVILLPLSFYVGKGDDASGYLLPACLMLAIGIMLCDFFITHLPGEGRRNNAPTDSRQQNSARQHSPHPNPLLGKEREMDIRLISLRNIGIQRKNSLLLISIISMSVFLLITIAANTKNTSNHDIQGYKTGSGGFALIATVSNPLPVDFNTESGRRKLGFLESDEPILKDMTICPLLISKGEDISCRNIYKPSEPRVIGIDQSFIGMNRFTVICNGKNNVPWQKLAGAHPGTNIPVFGDADTVRWVLESDLGKTYLYTHNSQKYPMTFQGLLPGSIFAGDLLIPASDFKRLFPNERSPRYFLIETKPGMEKAVADALRRNLGDLGVEIQASRNLLLSVASVQNTYLSAFETLGGLSLLLGIASLSIVILRNARDRRKEFAMMIALGFRKSNIMTLLAQETIALILAGTIIGILCGITAVTPYLAKNGHLPNWPLLCGLIAMVIVTGIAVSYAACITFFKANLVTSLRNE